MESEQKFFLCGAAMVFAFLTVMLITDAFKPPTKTCYVTEWKWEKSSNGVRVRVPVKQVCVKGDGDVSSK